ncbi:MAG: hypothetical protein HeimC2_44430 [Candidatus Heimdallarchaeota archaeon LC_2]|nr:MAG: hypothetical protein HeimC2_44430 [Candidatus Heimdallarchaeota archaeon LC_2]
MAIFKKLNDNHLDLPNEELWDRSKYRTIKENGFLDYTRLNNKFYAKSIYDKISSEEEIEEILTKFWRSKNDKTFDVLVIHENEVSAKIWQNKQLEIWENLQSKEYDKEYNIRWLFIFDMNENTIITPDKPESAKGSILSKFNPKNYYPNKFQRELKNKRFAQYTLQSIFSNEQEIIEHEIIVKQLNKSEKSIEKWKQRLKNRNHWDEDEEIIHAGSMHITRSNWKVRSNLTRRGRFIMTNKKMVYIRRKFAFFGFGALIPLFVFVRPSNKLLLFFQTIIQILKVPIQLFKVIRPVAAPVVVGFAFSFSFFDFSSIREFWSNITSLIPGLDFLSFGIGWVIENPQVLPVIAGSWVLINNAIRLIFMRGEELIILPYEQFSTLFLDGSMLVGRWKVKGISTVRAPENGLEYKMRLRDLNNDSKFETDRNLVLANNAFNYLMTSGKYIETSEKSGHNSVPD